MANHRRHRKEASSSFGNHYVDSQSNLERQTPVDDKPSAFTYEHSEMAPRQ